MSDEFQSRMDAAIARGKRRADAKESAKRAAKMSEEERRRLHTQYRLELSESIEKAVHQVSDHFPGFRIEGLFGEVGWGTACFRDDLAINSGQRQNRYSRLEMVIRPYSDLGVLDLKAKGTVANREIFNRGHFVAVTEVEIEEFHELVQTWAIEYAEMYAAGR